jgi:hypothetical protein
VSPEPAPGSLPAAVARVLDETVAAAREAFGADLHAVVLFGSAAEGQLRPTSDVNTVFVLQRWDAARAEAFREPLRLAQAAIRLGAMFLVVDEIPAAAGAFAQKFADIGRRRRVLFGPDPFAGLAIPRERLLARLDQVLLNLSLRMRAQYVGHGGAPERAALIIADLAGPLRTAAQSLLELEGRPAASPKEALRALAEPLGPEWAAVLGRLSEAREQGRLAPEVIGPTFGRPMELAALMRARVAALRRP